MSSIVFSGDRYLQRVGNREAELGRIEWEESSKKWVLWLKDTPRMLSDGSGYIRGDEYDTRTEVLEKALPSPSVSIMHLLWLRNVIKEDVADELENNREQIVSELGNKAKWKKIRKRIAEHFDALPKDELKQWGKKIGEAALVGELIKLAKQLLGV